MKKIMILMMMLLALPLSQARALEKLAVDQTRLAFGAMKEGVVAKKVVTLTNTGNTVIGIKNVTTS